MTLDESLKDAFTAAKASRHGAASSIAGGGGGPHFPNMEARIAKVEDGLNDVRLVLARMEPVLASLATKADVVKVEGALNTLEAKVSGLDARVGRVELSVGTTLTTAVGKAIGPAQFIAMVGGAAVILGSLVTLYAWLSHQPWFPH